MLQRLFRVFKSAKIETPEEKFISTKNKEIFQKAETLKKNLNEILKNPDQFNSANLENKYLALESSLKIVVKEEADAKIIARSLRELAETIGLINTELTIANDYVGFVPISEYSLPATYKLLSQKILSLTLQTGISIDAGMDCSIKPKNS